MDKVKITSLHDVFLQVAPNGEVTREQFQIALKTLEKEGLNEIANTPYADRLFTLLDINEDGVVDFKEFISGFALLCSGSIDDKIRGIFENMIIFI